VSKLHVTVSILIFPSPWSFEKPYAYFFSRHSQSALTCVPSY